MATGELGAQSPSLLRAHQRGWTVGLSWEVRPVDLQRQARWRAQQEEGRHEQLAWAQLWEARCRAGLGEEHLMALAGAWDLEVRP